MGTTYQAQVEVFFPASEHHVDMWQAVSRWELQKDYSFSMALDGVSQEGWPRAKRGERPGSEDVLLIGERPHPKYGYDLVEGKRWIEGELFAELDTSDCFSWARLLVEHVRSLVKLHPNATRVVVWSE